MRRWATLAIVGMTASGAACASILGIEEGTVDNSEGGSDGGGQICVADGGEHPDTSMGLFVYGDIGADTSNCGNEATPCKTIGFGLGKAKATSGKTTVYVAVSTKSPYAETITLAPGI
ncbi:MAG: hypothetical protein ABI461_16070, partial [Polyangiaceae bacterium]